MEQDIDKLISLFIQLKRTLSQSVEGSFEKKMATILQSHVLFFLEHEPQATMSEIAKHTGGSLSSTTQLLERLHKAGLLIREADEKDRRIIRHALTSKGIAEVKQIKAEKREQVKKIFAQLTEAERKSLINILEKLLHTNK